MDYSNHTLPSSTFLSYRLPDHCAPTSAFLQHVSTYTHTCIPTPLACLSVLLGCMSIISWLFAQLPQIMKNFRLRSTSGLSIFFLVEWCLGDVSNLVGALLTHQATWQVIIAVYYCFVDLMLVAQWVWYEKLKHGRHLRRMWLTKYLRQFEHDSSAMQQVVDVSRSEDTEVVGNSSPHATAGCERPGTSAGLNSGVHAPNFRTPSYSASQGHHNTGLAPPQPRTIRRAQASSNPLPSPSPRTILYISMLVCLCSTGIASPTPSGFNRSLSLSVDDDQQTGWTSETIGVVISWLSTVLYLGSRLPQLVKNARLRSTAGLSPLLFLAAFLGNFFYSTSMLTNPLLYASRTPPYGAGGWNDSSKEVDRVAWIANALPFFLGAAGVLIMDASVGLQFWLFRVKSANLADEVIVVVNEDERRSVPMDHDSRSANEHEPTKPLHMHVQHWRRVSGWMRGWSPAVVGSWASGIGTPTGGSFDGGSIRSGIEGGPARLSGVAGERTRLLEGSGEQQDNTENLGYGAV